MNAAARPASNPAMRQRAGFVVAIVAALSCVAGTAWALAAGARAPEIGLRDRSNQMVNLASLRGQVFVVDFWASWCAPCAQEMPFLEGLYASLHQEGFTVIGVSQDSDAGHIDTFLGRVHVSFPIAQDTGQAVAHRYGPGAMPTTFIVDRRGIVRYVHNGFRRGDAATIEREIRALIAEPRP
jgi:cytochrome c biogenesis protein CcmG/thiol:disulfide interchange protein DsbE